MVGPPADEPFRGLILCGGASRRMGRDKALIEVDGVALVAIAAAALRGAGATTVSCVGGDAEELGRLGLPFQPDDQPGEGPLGGLLSAFERDPTGVVMVLTCDLPLVDAEVVRAVVTTAGAHPHAAVAAPRFDGRLQLLSAAYRPALVLDHLRSCFTSGQRAVRAVLAHVEVVEVDLPAALAAKLHDADTPQRLAELTGAELTEWQPQPGASKRGHHQPR
ncbi:MAG: molybdenum cofactor guanylyltransferase [Acidimicrobiales bacterium]